LHLAGGAADDFKCSTKNHGDRCWIPNLKLKLSTLFADVNFQHNLCRFCPEDMFLHSVCRSVDGPGYCGSHSSCVPSSRPGHS
jgi:hypothetical protein